MKKLIIGFAFVLWIVHSFGQVNAWANYTCQTSVQCLAQEGNILWIGTTGGLIKYNTVTAEKTYYNAANSGLLDNSVTAIEIDSSGNKWIGMATITSGGVVKFDGTNWTVYNSFFDVTCLEMDLDGNLWVGSSYAGLEKYDGTEWTHYSSSNSDLNASNILSLKVDAENNLWVGTENHNLYKFDGTDWTQYVDPVGYAQSVNAITFDCNGLMWLACQQVSGLSTVGTFDGTTWTLYSVSNMGLSNGIARSVCMDAEGNIWIGTSNGIARFDGIDWTVFFAGTTGIIQAVTALLPDSQNNLWVGTAGGKGLTKYNHITWSPVSYANTALPDNYISSVVIDEDGIVWIGTERGLCSLNGTEWTVYDSSNSPLPTSMILTLKLDTQNNLWVGTGGHGAYRFDGINWINYNTSNSELPDSFVWYIAFDAQGNTWLSTSSGLAKFDGQYWQVYTTENSDIPGNCIKDIRFDAAGILWGYLPEIGLVKFDGANWTTISQTGSGIPLTNIWSFTVDLEGHIWIGCRYRPYPESTLWKLVRYADGVWREYSLLDCSFINTGIFFINQFTPGEIWFDTSWGLVRFDGTSWDTYESQHPGMPDNDFHPMVRDITNKVWGGTYHSGVVTFDYAILGNNDDVAVPAPNISVYPNPFGSEVKLDFDQQTPGYSELAVYNLKGQKVKTIAAVGLTKGGHSFSWDGKNEQGTVCRSGVYLVKLNDGKSMCAKKLVFLP